MKKRKKCFRRIALLLATVLLVGAVDFSVGPLEVCATSTTKDKIEQEEKAKDQLENQLDATNENINSLKGEQSQLQKELDTLTVKQQEVAERLNSLEQQIKEKEQEIADTQAALDEARQTEEQQKESMSVQVRCMYEMNSLSYLSMLLSAGSFADLLNMAYYIEKVMAYDHKQLEQFTATRIFIEEEEAKLQRERLELQALQAQAEGERQELSNLINQTNAMLAEYADDIEEAEKKALEYEKAIKKKEETLEALQKKLAQEIALAQAAANAQWRDISEVQFAEDDLYLLANLIYCEAGGEPYVGQVAVGSVVLNRVLSSKFPDTVAGVIYQKGQFAPVASGRLALALAVNKATPSCYKAAEEAMAGVTNVGNCLFFRTPIPGLTGIQIGGHIFY